METKETMEKRKEENQLLNDSGSLLSINIDTLMKDLVKFENWMNDIEFYNQIMTVLKMIQKSKQCMREETSQSQGMKEAEKAKDLIEALINQKKEK